MEDTTSASCPPSTEPGERLHSIEMTPPASPTKTAEKNAAADATNPILASPPPLRVSPPPSYVSGSFRRCDNKQPSNCVYCGGGATSPYWTAQKGSLANVQAARHVRGMTLVAFALLFVVAFALLVYGKESMFRAKPFNGWCGTSYVDEGRPKQFAQEMEISADDMYEKIQVPRFGMNRPAVFVHDFRKNVTAIVDVLGDRCFLKPLDRTVVVPPKNFIDLLQKMENGYYAQNPRVIHETFRVGNRLDSADVLNLGSAMVSRHCNNKDVFQLVKAARSMDSPYFVRDRRGIKSSSTTPKEAAEVAPLQFSVLNGDNVGVERIIF